VSTRFSLIIDYYNVNMKSKNLDKILDRDFIKIVLLSEAFEQRKRFIRKTIFVRTVVYF